MPTLKQITCSVNCDNDIKLREHATSYSDGFVSSYIVVPSKPTKFDIHVTSEGYIAPGLAIYVFIDGVPQCNRNRTGLLLPSVRGNKSDWEVEFRLRQKEEKLEDGRWVGREWTFAGLNTDAADATQSSTAPHILHSVGTIEIIVLRCQGDDASTTAADKQAPAAGKQAGGKQNQQTKNEPKKVSFKVKGSSMTYTLDGASDHKRDYNTMLGLDGTNEQSHPNQYHYQYQQFPGQYQPQQYQQQQGPAPNPGYGYQYDPRWQQMPQNQPYPSGQYNQPYPGQSHMPPGPQPLHRGFVGMNSWQPPNAPTAPRSPKKQGGEAAVPQNVQQQNTAKVTPAEFLDEYGHKIRGWITQPASVTSSTKSRTKDDNPVPAAMDWGETKSTTSWTPEAKPQETATTAIGWGVTAHEKKDDDNKTAAESMGWDNSKKIDEAKAWDNSADWGAAHEKKADDVQASGGDVDWGNSTAKEDDKTYGEANDATDAIQADNNAYDWSATTPATTTAPTDNTTHDWNSNTAPAQTTVSTKRMTEPVKRRRKKEKPDEEPIAALTAQPVTTAPTKPLDPSKPHLKAYFTTWTQSPSPGTAATFTLPATPAPAVPASYASTANLTHQLQTGAGTPYTHRTSRPRYLDSMSKPYAVFVFKYRSREKLAEILNVDVDKIKQDRQSLTRRMQGLSREQVLELYMRAKAKAGYATDSSLGSSGGESGGEVVVVQDIAVKKREKKVEVVEKKEDVNSSGVGGDKGLTGVVGNWMSEAAAPASGW